MNIVQPTLFGAEFERKSRMLPIIGEQKDISYYAIHTKNAVNTPEVTGMGAWSLNPYVGCAFGCAYCYARYAHRYAMDRAASADRLSDSARDAHDQMPPWLAFERHIFVKRNAPELLRHTLRSGSDRYRALAEGDTIVIGTATDPYQPAERRFRITRGLLEAFAEHSGLCVVIITKSPLITRDIDVLTRLARRSTLRVHLSLISLDRELLRMIEPRAPTPESRVRALARLRAHGIDAGINCMPVLPGITDDPRQIEALIKRVADAGATHVGACALRLQRTARERYLPFIDAYFPHLSGRYRATYARDYQAHARYRAGLTACFEQLCARYGVAFRDYGEEAGDVSTMRSARVPDLQLTLPLDAKV